MFWNEVRGIYISPDKTNGKKSPVLKIVLIPLLVLKKEFPTNNIVLLLPLDIVCVEELIILETFPLNFFIFFL